jgi:hypothetical protein
MATIQWRPEGNLLTNPKSYKARIMPRVTMDYAAVAEAIAARNPNFSAVAVETILRELREEVRIQLNNGNAVVLKDFCSFKTTANVRLETPSSPMPPPGSSLMTTISASRTLRDDVRTGASYEKLPATEKAPVITSIVDTHYNLPDVITAFFIMDVVGSNLQIGPDIEGSKVTITGSRNGEYNPTVFPERKPSRILFSANQSSQTDPWNNEWQVSVTTRYTENGSLRTGTYNRYLRAPLTISHSALPKGCLSSGETAALANVTDNTGNETIRICADVNAQDDILRFWLTGMTQDSAVGDAVIINANQAYTLTGFAGSAVTSLEVTTVNWEAIKTLVKTKYTNRMYDILNITA